MKAQEKIYRVENKVDVLAAKVDAFIDEMRDFKKEMRDRDNQRAAETEALRAEMIKRDDKLAEMVDGMGKHVRNITIAAIVGIGAAIVGIGSMIFSVINR